MAVLLQYNDADQWTMSQLAESTQIKKDILVQVNFKLPLVVYKMDVDLKNTNVARTQKHTDYPICYFIGASDLAQV